MIERQLSNHVHSHLVRAEQQEEQARTDEHAALDAKHQAAAVLAATRRTKPLWRRLLALQSADERVAAELVEYHHQHALDAGRHIEQARIDRAKAESGQQGERVLPDWFRSRLSDQWRMYHGCYNNRGEIDHLLLGPPGLWAIEVKSIGGKLLVFGDDWDLTELDTRGNEVGRKRAADSTGRNWGRQVSEPAAVLEKRLNVKGYRIPVHTAVVMVSKRAVIADVIQPGVDLVTASVAEFDRVATTGPPVLDTDQLAAIDELIVEHHRHFEK